ncbi:putative transposase, MuDR, plant [Plasmopara halstedii]
MVESSPSDGDAIVLSSESECDQQASQSCGEFFHSGEHTCKDDIISAVIDYHAAIYRPFRLAKSDQLRYKAICKNEGCPLKSNFRSIQAFSHLQSLSHMSVELRNATHCHMQ